MGIKFYDSNGKYWGEYDETRNLFIPFKKRTMRDCYNCKRYEAEGECIECHYEPKDEPQYDFGEYADRLWKIAYERGKREALEQTEPQTEVPNFTATDFGKGTITRYTDEPQTDGYMTAEQTEDYRKMLNKAEHKVYGNIKDEPQTERNE